MSNRFREVASGLLLLVTGMVPRLVMVSWFPTIPFSDFQVVVDFARHFQKNGLLASGAPWLWDNFSPGAPVALSFLFDIFPTVDPGAVARVATAFACGLVPLLPFLIWRGVLPLWVRLLAGAVLGLWPGQILYSGTVAHDNWIILPTVALAALAVKSLVSGVPVGLAAAGLVYAAGVAIRHDMMFPLFPLFLAAVQVKWGMPLRRFGAVLLAFCLPLTVVATQRYLCTGRFSLSTRHSGLSVLGSYVPGAATNGWTPPRPFVASVRPDLLLNRDALQSEALSLAVHEALRRPAFHAVRIVSSVVNDATRGEATSLSWGGVGGPPEALPERVRPRAALLTGLVAVPLRLELAAVQGLFLAALIVGVYRRNLAVLTLGLAVILKYALHAVSVSIGRYYYAATALEFLAIIVMAYCEFSAVRQPDGKRLTRRALRIGAAFSLVLLLAAPRLTAFVRRYDTDAQRTYRFPLTPYGDPGAKLDCSVSEGFLMSLGLEGELATIRTPHQDPAPGEKAVAVCKLTGAGEPKQAVLQIQDAYAAGGFPERMLQRVELDGSEIYSHDMAKEPGACWTDVPLGNVGAGTNKMVVIETRAIKPDPGFSWGQAAPTSFRLSR